MPLSYIEKLQKMASFPDLTLTSVLTSTTPTLNSRDDTYASVA
jgi:hypothetical protein